MSDATIDGPRLAHREDMAGILDLVDRCFNHPNGGMAAEWSHCYDENQPDQNAVITRDGEVVSHIGGVTDTLVVDGGEFDCIGITGVATDPHYRGNGYMRQLLGFWLDSMDKKGIPLSKLGGNRKRYGRFGWESVGQDRRYRITEKSFGERHEAPEHVEHYDGSDSAIDFISELYSSKRYRVKRNRDTHRTRLGRSHLETIRYAASGHEAYLTFARGGPDGPGTITEVAGSEVGLRTLLTYVFQSFSVAPLQARVHPNDPLNEFFASPDVSANWTTHPHREINIRDLRGVLVAFETQLSRRWEHTEAGTVVLDILDDEEAVELSYEQADVAIDPVTADPDIELTRRAMARLLFGYSETVPGYDGHPFLDIVLPLDFYVHRTDQV